MTQDTYQRQVLGMCLYTFALGLVWLWEAIA